MANINALTRNKQWLLLSGILVAMGAAGAGGWYLSQRSLGAGDKMNKGNQVAKEPPPDMTGVVNQSFDDKLQRSAITQTQVDNKEVRSELAALRQELGALSRERKQDGQRLASLEKENGALKAQLAQGGGVASDGGAGREPQPTPSTTPGTAAPGTVTPRDIPPPTAFYPLGGGQVYPGMGSPSGAVVTYQPIAPAPPAIETVRFADDKLAQVPAHKYPYLPSGSFAEAVVIEGADTNAAVTGAQNTAPMQLRLTGLVQLPNDHTVDLIGCFVTLEAYGDVSSERAIVRSRGLSCKLGDDIIDQRFAGHVSFMGKNGIKGEVVMRNGEILGWAWGAGFVDGIGAGIEKAATPQVGIGGTASMGAGDIMQAGIGGGTGQAAKTLSDYYIKRAEQYHPIIPIGAGNEVTLVFQDGFQLETLAEAQRKKQQRGNRKPAPTTPAGDPQSTPNMLSQLREMKVGDLVSPTQAAPADTPYSPIEVAQ